jgi:hypothetical protein
VGPSLDAAARSLRLGWGKSLQTYLVAPFARAQAEGTMKIAGTYVDPELVQSLLVLFITLLGPAWLRRAITRHYAGADEQEAKPVG